MTETFWLGNTPLQWTVAVLGGLLAYVLLQAGLSRLAARLDRRAQTHDSRALHVAASVIRATRRWLLLVLALVVALRFLTLPPAFETLLSQMTVLLVGLQVALWLTRAIVAGLDSTGADGKTPRNPVITGVLSWTAQIFVWVLLMLVVLSNAGVNVNAFIASLGVGGIAVALAAQNILGDLFASISIGLDKPFEVGEYIDFGGDSGTVKRVGIKSTRIQALSGEEISMANSALLQKMVRNYDRMDERRVAFKFRLAMDTPRSAVERIVDEVSNFIRSKDNVRFDRGHMTGFGEYSFDFEFVYYVVHPGFVMYRDIQQQINLEIMGLLEDMGVRFAVPVLLPRDPQMAPA